MADTKISGLTAGTPGTADTFPFQRGGTNNFKSTPQDMELSAIYGQTVGTPVATDTIPFQRGGANVWQGTFSNNIAGKLYSANGTTYPVGTLTDTQYLMVIGGTIVSGTVASGTNTGLPAGTLAGDKLAYDGTSALWIHDDFSATYIISSPTATTLYPAFECGFDGTIEAFRLYSGTTKGNGTVDIYKMTYANIGTGTPGTAFSIVGTATKPALSGTNVYEGTVFTGWTATTFSKGDWLMPYVTGAGTITSLSVAISGRKTAVS